MTKKITTIFCDVDGTLTDGVMTYTKEGLASKNFNTKDASAINRIKKLGYKVIWVTDADGASLEITQQRAKDLDIELIVGKNGQDKHLEFIDYLAENKIFRHNAAYLGDDYNDIPCMERVNFVGITKDSAINHLEPDLFKCVIVDRKGGEGALAAFIGLIMLENINRKNGE